MSSYGTIYGMLYPPKKAELTMRERIVQLLKRGPVTGQTEMIRELQLAGGDLKAFNATLTNMLCQRLVRETMRQLPGTGHEGPPVYEYTYSLVPGAKP